MRDGICMGNLRCAIVERGVDLAGIVSRIEVEMKTYSNSSRAYVVTSLHCCCCFHVNSSRYSSPWPGSNISEWESSPGENH